MNTIYIGNYNNYYNRIHKPALPNMYAYTQAGFSNYHYFNDINFNRADGINTKLTINLNPTDTGFNDHVNPDYLCVCSPDTTEYNPVFSRWFVLEAEWNRDHQLILTLRRDLLADFWAYFKDNDFYCEKGAIPSGYDVAKYNSEGMTFNQQLKGRYYLKPSDMGSSDKRYLVGYIDKTWSGSNIVYADVYAEYDSVLDCPLYSEQGVLLTFDEPEQVKYVVRFSSEAPTYPNPAVAGNGYILQGHWNADGTNYAGHVTPSTNVLNLIGEENISSSDANDLEDYIGANAGQSMVEYALSDWESMGARINDEVTHLNGKLIRIGDSFYNVSLSSYTYNNTPIYSYRAINAMQWAIAQDRPDSYNDDIYQPETGSWPRCQFLYLQHTVTTVTLTAYSGSVISLYDRKHIDTVPYDIFYIEDSTSARKFCGYLASRFMKANVIYDIQLLPFHPEASSGSGSTISLPDGSTLHWASNDHAYGNLSGAPTLSYSTDTEYKVASNTSTCRLYSPDGASCWEFNPAKIGGVKDGDKPIKYEVTFAPLLVYMHIFPTFGGLYGSVNKTLGENKQAESRGLICRGDYSIPYSSNNWSAYQLQNSAYQLAHDRQITNMSVNFQAERAQELVNILGGTVSGTFAGAQSGGMMGGVYGAVAGGVVGGAGSLVSGLVGRSWNERLRTEEMSYAEDMFAYSLQNIQMQAQPLSHSNYITIGNSYYPYLEVYDCTDTEKTIFTERLRINGWSLGIVTTIANMKTVASASGTPTNFVKGKLVKFDGDEDAHVCAEINIELERGVRFV